MELNFETIAAVIGGILIVAKAALVLLDRIAGITPGNADNQFAGAFRRGLAVAVKIADRLSLNPDAVKARPGKRLGKPKTPTLMLFLLVALSGCAFVPQQAGEAFGQLTCTDYPPEPAPQLACTYTNIGALARSTEYALNTGTISAETAQAIFEKLVLARDTADKAAVLLGGVDAGAGAKVDAAQAVLAAIARQLEEKDDE